MTAAVAPAQHPPPANADEDQTYDDDCSAWYATAAAAEEGGGDVDEGCCADDPYGDDGVDAAAAGDPYLDASEGDQDSGQPVIAEASATAEQSLPCPLEQSLASGAPKSEPVGEQSAALGQDTASLGGLTAPLSADPSVEGLAPSFEQRIHAVPTPSASAGATQVKGATVEKPERNDASEEQSPEAGVEPVVKDEDIECIDDEPTWDETILIVRQGQVHIELQNQAPPMHDEDLLRFCDWLAERLPEVVRNFPYVRSSGAYIDLSDNKIGPDGLDKLFRVLREARVPCNVVKAYRNCLDDSIVDTFIEYLYTQPEAFPMHGIHISHNQVTDKGAMRLIRAAAGCGHYPRLTSRLPLWLRLEYNDIKAPQRLVADCNSEEFNVCLMSDGLCSRPNCNHYSGIHVQLPYFFNQARERTHAARPSTDRRQSGDAANVPKEGMLKPKLRPSPTSADKGLLAPAIKRARMGERLASEEPALDDEPTRAGSPRPPNSQPPPLPSSASQGQRPILPIGSPRGSPRSCNGDGWRAGGGGWRDAGPPRWQGGAGGVWGGGQHPGPKGDGKGGGCRRQMWHGLTIPEKMKMEVRLSEADPLGFTWRRVVEGECPQVTSVEPGSTASQAAAIGQQLLRVNGLDTSILNEKQIVDVLKQRPTTLRFGDQ